jgi:hypothetical protein
MLRLRCSIKNPWYAFETTNWLPSTAVNCYLHTPHVSRNSLPEYFQQHGTWFVPKSLHDFLMEHREQRSHFVCNLFALARHLFVKKKRRDRFFTITPFVLHCWKSPSKLNTYLLTRRSRVLLDKLTGLQLVKYFPAFYWTQRFITAFTSARHLSLSWASSIQSKPPFPTSWKFI